MGNWLNRISWSWIDSPNQMFIWILCLSLRIYATNTIMIYSFHWVTDYAAHGHVHGSNHIHLLSLIAIISFVEIQCEGASLITRNFWLNLSDIAVTKRTKWISLNLFSSSKFGWCVIVCIGVLTFCVYRGCYSCVNPAAAKRFLALCLGHAEETQLGADR